CSDSVSRLLHVHYVSPITSYYKTFLTAYTLFIFPPPTFQYVVMRYILGATHPNISRFPWSWRSRDFFPGKLFAFVEFFVRYPRNAGFGVVFPCRLFRLNNAFLPGLSIVTSTLFVNCV